MNKKFIYLILAIAGITIVSCSQDVKLEPTQKAKQILPTELIKYYVSPIDAFTTRSMGAIKTSNVVGEDVQGHYEGKLTYLELRGKKKDVPEDIISVDIYKDDTNPHQFRFVIQPFKAKKNMPATISTDLSKLVLENDGSFKAVNLDNTLIMKFSFSFDLKNKITLLEGKFDVYSESNNATLKFTLDAVGPFGGLLYKANVKFEVTRKYKF